MAHDRKFFWRIGSVVVALVILSAAAVLPADPGDPDEVRRRARRRSPVVEVFEQAKDSVVNISSTQIINVRSSLGIDSFFEELFDFPVRRPRVRTFRQESVGSGFVLHPAGYIVTNAHVVARTAERRVIFADKSEFDAQIVAIDTQHDLAVLKIKTDRALEPIRLGTSGDLMVGEMVIAIGNALGYQHSVTAGVISALDRRIDVHDDASLTGLIQTDASINPGNSGGPLLNVLGELVGINTAIRADAENIGFAVPVDHLRRLLPELLDVERRYRIHTGMQVGENGRARVTAVEPESSAARAEVRTNDLILRVDDQPVRTDIDYHIAMIGRRPGDRVRLQVQTWGHAGRDAQTFERTMILGDRPLPDGARLLNERFGIRAVPLTRERARSLGLRALMGLVISGVDPGSVARRADIRRGDIIVQIGRYQTADLKIVGELLEGVERGKSVPITILRISGRQILRWTIQIKAQ